jgi:ligand-binding SRPBCC domain-containing protein
VFGHHVLRREQRLPGSPAEVFPFFADAGNLEAITPPWLRFEVVTPRPIAMRPGALIEYRLVLHRLPVAWLTRIEEWDTDPARPRFVDMQLTGPYKLWHHTHEFRAHPDGGTVMTDTVRYALPYGALGALAHRVLVRRDVELIFDYRARAVPARLTSP